MTVWFISVVESNTQRVIQAYVCCFVLLQLSRHCLSVLLATFNMTNAQSLNSFQCCTLQHNTCHHDTLVAGKHTAREKQRKHGKCLQLLEKENI